jgi:hypothetical protein
MTKELTYKNLIFFLQYELYYYKNINFSPDYRSSTLISPASRQLHLFTLKEDPKNRKIRRKNYFFSHFEGPMMNFAIYLHFLTRNKHIFTP